MSKLLQERWKRIAFDPKRIDESGPNTIDRRDAKASLELLKEFGFYFAGVDTVVLGDLDDISGKRMNTIILTMNTWDKVRFMFK